MNRKLEFLKQRQIDDRVFGDEKFPDDAADDADGREHGEDR